MSYLRTLSVYLPFLVPDEVDIVMRYSDELLVNFNPEGRIRQDNVAFTLGCELVSAQSKHGIGVSGDQIFILRNFAESAMMQIGLEALSHFTGENDECCEVIVRSCNAILEVLAQELDPDDEGSQIAAMVASIQQQIARTEVIPVRELFECWRHFTGESAWRTGEFIDTATDIVLRETPDALEFAQLYFGFVLSTLDEWGGFWEDVSVMFLKFVIAHPHEVRGLCNSIIIAYLKLEPSSLGPEDFSGIVDMVSGFIQLNLVSVSDFPEIVSRLGVVLSGEHTDDVELWHGMIRLLANVYFAGGNGFDEEVMNRWIELMRQGWFSSNYGRRLCIQCFMKLVGEGAGDPFPDMIMALITNQLPPLPGTSEYQYLWETKVSMPLESIEIEGFVEGD
jgi:hypothetical protein